MACKFRQGVQEGTAAKVGSEPDSPGGPSRTGRTACAKAQQRDRAGKLQEHPGGQCSWSDQGERGGQGFTEAMGTEDIAGRCRP